MKYVAFRDSPGTRLGKWAVSFIAAVAVAALLFYLFYMCPRRVTPILMYHSISDKKNSSLCVAPVDFARQMEFLHKKGYSVISLDALVQEIKKGRTYLPGTVVVTFDDGFEDNFTSAFPVLAKHKMSATIFLITDYLDRQKGYLKWDQVLLMRKNGMSSGDTRATTSICRRSRTKRSYGKRSRDARGI